MNPYEGVAALRRAQQELDDVVVHLGSVGPVVWRGPGARAFVATKEDLVGHVVAAQRQLAHAEWLMARYAAEVSLP
ncbi:hypothetical protein SAMN06298212_10721 [Ruaniaceae bacterium KH17]|nr:hypothetical protein SAMN06298212_10721 [Ruaniaceae bacterium KH17]